MSEGAVGFLVLISISVAVAVTGHALSARYVLASILSGLLSVALWLALVIARGDRDPLIAIAAMVAAAISITIAVFVGMPFAQRRARRAAATGPHGPA